MKIERHHFDDKKKELHTAYFSEIIDKLKKSIEFNPKNAGFIFKSAFSSIGDAVVCKKPNEEVFELIYLATELGVNYFRNVRALEGTSIVMEIQEEEFEVTAKPDNSYSNTAYWQRYFYCAMISRNGEAIDELSAIPEEIFRASEIVYDEVDFAIVRFLKGIYQDVKIAPLLLEAIKMTAHELNEKERLDYLDYIKLPELELYMRIFGNENEKFNISLGEALESHKKFWKKDPNNPQGWISFPIICACIIAYESYDFKIEVESDYLPMWLVTRD
jgi:hypothetical protein